jgi:hypothetical protein
MICKECSNERTILSDESGTFDFCFFCFDKEMAELANTIAGKFRVRAIAAQGDDSLAGEIEEQKVLKEIEAAALLPWPMDGHYTFADGSKLEWYGWALKLDDLRPQS